MGELTRYNFIRYNKTWQDRAIQLNDIQPMDYLRYKMKGEIQRYLRLGICGQYSVKFPSSLKFLTF